MVLRVLTAVLVLCFVTSASAHTMQGLNGGFASGLEHPLFGFDHLLAMLAVGVWGAQMGGRLIWALPVAFPLVMAFGSLLGIAGLPLSHVELGIALSVMALGLVIALALRPPAFVALLVIAVFAIFHGYAHGFELPRAADPSAYAVGFVFATGLIHIAGVGIGLTIGKISEGRMAKGMGGLIAVAGLYFLIT